MMNNFVLTLLAFPGGLLLGTVFFGGLWLTIQYAVGSKTPALWFFFSFFLRISIALSGFYFVSGSHWGRLLVCLAGFVLARIILTRLTRPSSSALSHENQSR